MSPKIIPPQKASCVPENSILNRALLPLVLVLIGLLCFIAAYWFTFSIDADEIEHAHVTWALGQNILPYRDIHQIHTPFLWMIFWPVVHWMPKHIDTMLVLRGFCLLAFSGVFFVGLRVLREISGTTKLLPSLVLFLFCLSMLLTCDFYKFRPDPFMSLCSAFAILAAVRMRFAPRSYSFLSGIALGFAASFSPKMALLCLLVPVLCVLECFRLKTWRPLTLVFWNGLGFIVGILPVVLWLLSHGLFNLFWGWVVRDTTHMINAIWTREALEQSITVCAHPLAWAIVASVFLLQKQWHAPGVPWSPTNGLVVAAVLTLSIVVIEPNHLPYNIEAFVMPASVLGVVFVTELKEMTACSRSFRLAMISVVLGVSIIPSLLYASIYGVGLRELQTLIELCSSEDATCVGCAPYHPIFCRDASDVYLWWDYGFAIAAMVPPAERQKYIDMWPRVVSDIETATPTLVVVPLTLMAPQSGLVSAEQYRRAMKTLETRYDCVAVLPPLNVSAFLKKGTKSQHPIEQHRP
jgi:hypothetical protein